MANADGGESAEGARIIMSAQERTLRWWSECASAWRRKWAAMRDQRNELRRRLRDTERTLARQTDQFAVLARTHADVLARLATLEAEAAREREPQLPLPTALTEDSSA